MIGAFCKKRGLLLLLVLALFFSGTVVFAAAEGNAPFDTEYIKLGETYEIPVEGGAPYRVIDPNGNRISANGSFLASMIGVYRISYEGIGDREVVCTDSEPEIVIGEADLPAVVAAGSAVTVPKVYGTMAGKRVACEATVTAPSGKVAAVDGSFVAEEEGVYEVRFTASINGFAAERTVAVVSRFTKASAFLGVSDIVAIRENVAFPAYSEAGNGVQILGAIDGATFAYRRIIDLNGLDAEQDLIALQVLSGSDWAGMTSMDVTIRDAHDPDNAVVCRFVEAKDAFQHSYASVSYDGRFLGLSNEASKPGVIWNGKYGTVVYNGSFHGSSYQNVRPFRIQFDYGAGRVYTYSNGNRTLVLDLRDPAHVGKGKQWKGFTTGEVNLSVTMNFSSVRAGGVIVSGIAGKSLSGAFDPVTDSSVPVIRLVDEEQFAGGMPAGATGVAYPVPEARVTDWLTEVSEIRTKISYLEGGTETDVSETLAEGCFTPERAGRYAIRYSATNSFGNTGERELLVTVNEALPPVLIAADGELGGLTYRSYYRVPEFTVSGGSGRLTLTEQAEYGGERIVLGASRKIYIDKIAPLLITVTARGYTGEPVTRVFCVRFHERTVLHVSGVPKTVISGDTVRLPSFTAFDTADADAVVPREIRVNGVALPLDAPVFTVAPGGGESVRVQYVAGEGENRVVREFVLDVIEPSGISGYFVKSGEGARLYADTRGTVLEAEGNAQVCAANPVAANGAVARFYFQKAGCASLEVELTDLYDRTNNMRFTLAPLSGTTSLLTLDGKAVEISGSFSSGDSQFSLLLDGVNGTIKNSNGFELIKADSFCCLAMYVTFRLTGAYDSSIFVLGQLSNQVLNTNSFIMGDSRPPVIVTETALSQTEKVSMGETFTAPAAYAFDVIDPHAAVKVTVTDPAGAVLYEGACDSAQTFVASAYGFYRVTYTATDRSGRTATSVYRFKVVDEIAPVVRITGAVPEAVRVGETWRLPKLEARDNLDAAPLLNMYILDVADYSRTAVTPGTDFAFSQKGSYRLVIYCADAGFNVTRAVYTVQVS